MANVSKPRKRPVERPAWASVLVARRHSLGLRQEDITELTRDVITQGTVSDIERGKVNPTKMTIERFFAYLYALKWSGAEFSQQTGLDVSYTDELLIETTSKLQDALPEGEFVLERIKRSDTLERFAPPETDWTHFHVMHSASAGTGEPELLDDDEIVSIPTQKLRARGATQKDVMVVKVNGDCLVSQNLRTSRRSIAHGDYVFIHMGAAGQTGDIICVWDEQDSQLMLKFASEQQDPEQPDEITFYDAKGRSYIRNIADVKYRGVVFYRAGEL